MMGRMEERERNHEATLLAMEKDLALKQQAMDTFKKKVRGRGMPPASRTVTMLGYGEQSGYTSATIASC